MDSEKRKRESESSLSSAGDLDTSTSSVKQIKPKKKKGKKVDSDSQNKFSVLNEDDDMIESDSNSEDFDPQKHTDINSGLKQINEKLSDVMLSNSEILKNLIPEIVKNVREKITKIFEDKLDKLESRIFEVEIENDKLKKEMEDNKRESAKKEDELRQAIVDIDKTSWEHGGRINSLDQYSRSNNLVISGIHEDQGQWERPRETAEKVVKTLNEKLKDLNLKNMDIDICHRLGKIRTEKPRPVIVRFISRMTRNDLMYRRRDLKGTNIFVNEDLSHLNRHMLVNLKRMIPRDESMWVKDGTLYHKSANGHIQKILHSDYAKWMGVEKSVFAKIPGLN